MFMKLFLLLRREFPLQALDPRSYISAMLLALKSLLFFCLDIFEPLTCRVSNSEMAITFIG